jgi:hypothetical protein
MFYISTLELTLTCALIALLFIAPLMIKRSYAKTDKRLKDVEKKLERQ